MRYLSRFESPRDALNKGHDGFNSFCVGRRISKIFFPVRSRLRVYLYLKSILRVESGFIQMKVQMSRSRKKLGVQNSILTRMHRAEFRTAPICDARSDDLSFWYARKNSFVSKYRSDKHAFIQMISANLAVNYQLIAQRFTRYTIIVSE